MSPSPKPTVRVLVVEQRPDARLFVTRLFRQAGFDVSPFATAREAFASALQNAPDVLVTDVASVVARVGGDELDGHLANAPSLSAGVQLALIERVREAGLRLLFSDLHAEPFNGARLAIGAARLAPRPPLH